MTARTKKLRMTNDRFEELARERWGAHDELIAEGYELAPGSGLWRAVDGTATARLVYRQRDQAGITSIAITIRKIPVRYV